MNRRKGLNTIDAYACSSGLKNVNASYKIILSMAVICTVIAADRIIISLIVLLAASLATVLLGRIPVRVYAGFYKIPMAFLIMSTVAIAFGISTGVSGDFWIRLGPVYIYSTYQGIINGFRLYFKALGAVSSMYFLALSTPAGEVVSALKGFHLPGIIIELMNMIYRFIFVLMDTQASMQTAARSRLGYQGFKTSCRTFGLIGASLLVVSMKKAGAYYDALIARGYEGQLLFLEEEKSVNGTQILAFIGFFLLIALVIWLT